MVDDNVQTRNVMFCPKEVNYLLILKKATFILMYCII